MFEKKKLLAIMNYQGNNEFINLFNTKLVKKEKSKKFEKKKE